MAGAFVLACLTWLAAACQDPQGRTVFSSQSELVVLHVSVADPKTGFVAGLSREAFTVYEDGLAQSIHFFDNVDSPVSVGLVIDSSGSMHARRDAVIAAGLAFAQASRPDDELFTINFNEHVWPGLPAGQSFTSNLDELRTALQRSTARGQTALFDAVQASLATIDASPRQKKAIVVVSDGGDNASRAHFADVLDSALRMNVLIYAIGLYDENDRDANPRLLKQLAAATGGEAFFPKKLTEVTGVLESIARDLRSGYTLGYVPSATARPGYRAVKVEARTADRRRLTVRARRGYLTGAVGHDHK